MQTYVRVKISILFSNVRHAILRNKVKNTFYQQRLELSEQSTNHSPLISNYRLVFSLLSHDQKQSIASGESEQYEPIRIRNQTM